MVLVTKDWEIEQWLDVLNLGHTSCWEYVLGNTDMEGGKKKWNKWAELTWLQEDKVYAVHILYDKTIRIYT